jgi:predicted small secreted protein
VNPDLISLYDISDITLKRTTPMIRAAVILSLVLGLAACETTKGVGRDVENAGEALDDVF